MTPSFSSVKGHLMGACFLACALGYVISPPADSEESNLGDADRLFAMGEYALAEKSRTESFLKQAGKQGLKQPDPLFVEYARDSLIHAGF